MAAGFSVRDAFNKNSKAGMDTSPKARFRTKDISIFKMYRNSKNFYSMEKIEELAGDILMYGLKQNLELVYAPCEEGEYRIVAGERRWEALKYLVSKGYKEFELATSKLTAPQCEDEEQVEIIIANAYRSKNTADMLQEEKRLKESLTRMKAEGKTVKGYDLQSGRLRDVIASMMKTSKTKVAQIETINKNLIPEWQEEMKKERITFSAAYEISGLTAEEQKEQHERFGLNGELTHKEVKEIKAEKEEKAAESSVSESDTEESEICKQCSKYEKCNRPDKGRSNSCAIYTAYHNDERQQSEDGEYQTPHPEGITSLCYSCTEYETCNVKTGTCTKCDQYQNRAEAYKTDEQRYNEEQDAIDRETRKKLREQEQERKMQELPSDRLENKTKVHTIKLAKMYYEDVKSGKKSFELRKNDRGYKQGDILRMLEYAEGEWTGREMVVEVTYLLEDYAGLEEGYCIMALKVCDVK